jgi:hypothetical protein
MANSSLPVAAAFVVIDAYNVADDFAAGHEQ